MLRIDFLRHGALEGGIKYRGCLDERLTSQGLISMCNIWEKMQSEITMIVSSPLLRCAEPALSWAAKVQVPYLEDDRIKELSYGSWEGLMAKEIQEMYPGQLEAWRKDPTQLCPPQGEPMLAFAARTLDFWQDLMKRYDNEHVLIVAHSGSIRLLLAHLMGAPIKSTRCLAMPYACWSRAEVDTNQAQLIFHNKTI